MIPARTEYKFLISNGERDTLCADIGARLRVDVAAGGAGASYPIISQYFDSPRRDCYWEKQRRLRSRRKLRVRLYGEHGGRIPPAGFVEIKHKLDSFGGKRRLPVRVEVAERVASGDHAALWDLRAGADRAGRMVIDEVSDLVVRQEHVPSMQIRYDRHAFQSADQLFRVTFDSQVRCRPGGHPLRVDDRGLVEEVLDGAEVVMEVKSAGPVPYWFREWIARLGLVRRSFSKYCAALEKHDPVLKGQHAGVA